MNFNKTIPELSVFDINKSKNFYLNVLGAKIEYERQEDKFVFLSLEENQLMLEEIHDNGWNIG
ncbi:glyoxalase superfamily protein, partial [Bacillus paralicheniformis]